MPMMPAHVRLQDFLQQKGQMIIDELEANYRKAGKQP